MPPYELSESNVLFASSESAFKPGYAERSAIGEYMIETILVKQSPLIVHHRVSGLLSVNEAKYGAAIALSIVEKAVDLGSRLHLLLDMRGLEPGKRCYFNYCVFII